MESNPTTPVSKRPPFYRRLVSKSALRICLFAFACLVTLIALYHAEENWRGARDLNEYKRAHSATESLDWRKIIPPQVPDDQNFAMTPFLAPLFDFEPGTQVVRDTNAANRAREFSKDFAPDWHWSNDVDLVAFANLLTHPKGTPPNSPPQITDRKEAAQVILQRAEKYTPVLEEFRRASGRPNARFNIAYDFPDKVAIILPHLYMIRNTTRLLAVRATAELALGLTDRAFADTKLGLYLAEIPRPEPMLISQLVRQACLQVLIGPVQTGLREHQWTDAQLQQFEAALERVDFVTGVKLGLDGEMKMHGEVLEDLKGTRNRLKVINRWTALITPGHADSRNPLAEFLFWVAVPSGWIDFEQLNYRRFYLDKVDGGMNVENQSFQPEIATEADRASEKLASSGLVEKVLKHKVILTLAMPTFGKLATKTALAQAEAKMAQIACALERYRLANHQYPDELAALTPRFIAALPSDPVKGGQFDYRRTGDAFLLYSIGWNGADDGGKTVITGKVPHGDAMQGDWVWGTAVSF